VLGNGDHSVNVGSMDIIVVIIRIGYFLLTNEVLVIDAAKGVRKFESEITNIYIYKYTSQYESG